jgi:hypothetical protein
VDGHFTTTGLNDAGQQWANILATPVSPVANPVMPSLADKIAADTGPVGFSQITTTGVTTTQTPTGPVGSFAIGSGLTMKIGAADSLLNGIIGSTT